LLAYRAITALSAIAVFIAAVHLMILKKAPQRMQRYKGASFNGSHLCLQSVMSELFQKIGEVFQRLRVALLLAFFSHAAAKHPCAIAALHRQKVFDLAQNLCLL
jgi:hypothetical protein